MIVRDYPRSHQRLGDNASIQHRQHGNRSFDELDVGSLARSEDSRSIYYGRRMPTEKGKIFKVDLTHEVLESDIPDSEHELVYWQLEYKSG